MTNENTQAPLADSAENPASTEIIEQDHIEQEKQIINNELNKLNQLIEEDLLTFSQRINASLQSNLPQSAQTATGEILNLLPEVDQNTPPQIFHNIQIAFTALTQNPPQLTLAQQIIKDVRSLLKPTYALFGHNVPPTGLVIMGMIATLVIGIPLLVIAHILISSVYSTFFGEPVILVLATMLSGIMGSCVSIMVRINDFQALARSNAWVLFFNGFFKPIIGLSFALFLFAVIKSGIIPIAIQDGGAIETSSTFNNSEALFILAVAFISGFSERFAKDVASRVEDSVSGSVRQLPRSDD